MAIHMVGDNAPAVTPRPSTANPSTMPGATRRAGSRPAMMVPSVMPPVQAVISRANPVVPPWSTRSAKKSSETKVTPRKASMIVTISTSSPMGRSRLR